MKYWFYLVFIFIFSNHVEAKFFTGLGFIQISNHRVDNEISPLPLGRNFLPVLAYRGEKLRVFGPNITYSVLKGIIGLDFKLGATGDRFKSRDVAKRSGAFNAGVSFRLLCLVMDYGSDIFRTYSGNTASLGLAWRFKISDKIFLIPKIAKVFLNPSYTNYYYGVRENENSFFNSYRTKSAVNDELSFSATYKFSELDTFVLNYSSTIFDRVIYNSPTVSKRNFNRLGLFWSREI